MDDPESATTNSLEYTASSTTNHSDSGFFNTSCTSSMSVRYDLPSSAVSSSSLVLLSNEPIVTTTSSSQVYSFTSSIPVYPSRGKEPTADPGNTLRQMSAPSSMETLNSSQHPGSTVFDHERRLTPSSSFIPIDRPKTKPREFVTVVSVGEVDESRLKLRLNVPAEMEQDENERINYGSGESYNPDDPVNSFTDRRRQQDSNQNMLYSNNQESRNVELRSGSIPRTVCDKVVVLRLPGERLGLGLKFDGGWGARQLVRRVFIESIAIDSPGSRASLPWGQLCPGDQILNIEGTPVSSMTRLQCVAALRDSHVKVTIGILKGDGVIPPLEDGPSGDQEASDESPSYEMNYRSARDSFVPMAYSAPPPPLPPRTDFLKFSGRLFKETAFPGAPPGFMEEPAQYYVPDIPQVPMPPAAVVYLDLLAEEEERRARCGSESDETGSSASTVIDRLSLCSSTTVSRNSSFNASAAADNSKYSRFDLASALSQFEILEQEFERESQAAAAAGQQIASTINETHPLVSASLTRGRRHLIRSLSLSPGTYKDQFNKIQRQNEELRQQSRESVKSLSFSLKKRPFSWTPMKCSETTIKRTRSFGETDSSRLSKKLTISTAVVTDQKEESSPDSGTKTASEPNSLSSTDSAEFSPNESDDSIIKISTRNGRGNESASNVGMDSLLTDDEDTFFKNVPCDSSPKNEYISSYNSSKQINSDQTGSTAKKKLEFSDSDPKSSSLNSGGRTFSRSFSKEILDTEMRVSVTDEDSKSSETYRGPSIGEVRPSRAISSKVNNFTGEKSIQNKSSDQKSLDFFGNKAFQSFDSKDSNSSDLIGPKSLEFHESQFHDFRDMKALNSRYVKSLDFSEAKLLDSKNLSAEKLSVRTWKRRGGQPSPGSSEEDNRSIVTVQNMINYASHPPQDSHRFSPITVNSLPLESTDDCNEDKRGSGKGVATADEKKVRSASVSNLSDAKEIAAKFDKIAIEFYESIDKELNWSSESEGINEMGSANKQREKMESLRNSKNSFDKAKDVPSETREKFGSSSPTTHQFPKIQSNGEGSNRYEHVVNTNISNREVSSVANDSNLTPMDTTKTKEDVRRLSIKEEVPTRKLEGRFFSRLLSKDAELPQKSSCPATSKSNSLKRTIDYFNSSSSASSSRSGRTSSSLELSNLLSKSLNSVVMSSQSRPAPISKCLSTSKDEVNRPLYSESSIFRNKQDSGPFKPKLTPTQTSFRQFVSKELDKSDGQSSIEISPSQKFSSISEKSINISEASTPKPVTKFEPNFTSSSSKSISPSISSPRLPPVTSTSSSKSPSSSIPLPSSSSKFNPTRVTTNTTTSSSSTISNKFKQQPKPSFNTPTTRRILQPLVPTKTSSSNNTTSSKSLILKPKQLSHQSLPSTSQRFTQISRSSRIRHDLGDLIKNDLEKFKSDLNLPEGIEIEVEEEEEVERILECTTADEAALVVRAFRDESLLMDASNPSKCLVGTSSSSSSSLATDNGNSSDLERSFSSSSASSDAAILENTLINHRSNLRDSSKPALTKEWIRSNRIESGMDSTDVMFDAKQGNSLSGFLGEMLDKVSEDYGGGLSRNVFNLSYSGNELEDSECELEIEEELETSFGGSERHCGTIEEESVSEDGSCDLVQNSDVYRNNIRAFSNRDIPSDIIVSPPTPEPESLSLVNEKPTHNTNQEDKSSSTEWGRDTLGYNSVSSILEGPANKDIYNPTVKILGKEETMNMITSEVVNHTTSTIENDERCVATRKPGDELSEKVYSCTVSVGNSTCPKQTSNSDTINMMSRDIELSCEPNSSSEISNSVDSGALGKADFETGSSVKSSSRSAIVDEIDAKLNRFADSGDGNLEEHGQDNFAIRPGGPGLTNSGASSDITCEETSTITERAATTTTTTTVVSSTELCSNEGSEEDSDTEGMDSEGGAVSVGYERRLPPAPSPPSHSRLPPDGHEFPASYTDSIPPPVDKSSTSSSRYSLSRSHSRSRSRDGRDPSSSSLSFGSTSLTRTSSLSSRWRRQDEKSEKSVRDKIAMFSQSKGKGRREESESLDGNVDDEVSEVLRGFSEADVRSVQNGSPSPKLTKTTTFSSMINVSSENQDSMRGRVKPAASEVDVSQNGRHQQPSPSREENPDLPSSSDRDDSGLHHRSRSLVDIDHKTRGKRHSVGAYDRPSQFQHNSERSDERDRRTSLANLIELRRKSLSKLRGLVIPEAKPSEISSKPPIDLPRIGSSPPPVQGSSGSFAQKTLSLPRDVNRSQRLYKTDSISSIESCESNTSKQSSTISTLSWKTHNSTSTVSMFSPAVKRKGASVTRPDSLPPVSSRNTRSCSPASEISLTSPQKLTEGIVTPNSDLSFEIDNGKYSNDKSSYTRLPLVSKSSMDTRMNRSEDSDNDSAVSSTQSSFSQGITPPASPVPDSSDLDESRASARSQNRVRHSPQCSIDELDPKRVLKTGTVEAENRWNVLKSAKVSSGRSSDEHSTPELSRKSSNSKKDPSFPHKLESDLRDGPPRPGLKRHSSAESTSTLSSSRRSSQDSRRNSRDSVIHVAKNDEAHQFSVEQVYFDKQGDMYKESEIKVAYVNEITDDFEQVNESSSGVSSDVVSEIPLSGSFFEAKMSEPKGKESPSNDRWAALELKYGKSSKNDIESKISKLRSTEPSPVMNDRNTKITERKSTQRKPGGGGFAALAEKWKQRAEVDDEPPTTPRTSPPISSVAKPSRPDENVFLVHKEPRPSTLHLSRADVPDRKLSMPEYGNAGVRMRDRRSEGNNGSSDMPSRPSSLIENSSEPMQSLEPEQTYLSPSSPAASGSTDSLDGPGSLSRTSSKEVLEAFSKPRAYGQFVTVGSRMITTSAGPPRVSDIMRAFEYRGLSGSSHPRMSSVDSAASDDGSFGGHYGSVTSLASGTRDQYGSITSLASSTSIISTQELAQLIEEANQSLEESGTPSHEILVVVLHREVAGYGSVGITLAGGADYETREITVHKIIPGSLADRDGRIQRGDRVLSINGKTLRGVSHREALSILKSPRPEVVLVLSRSRSVTPQDASSGSGPPNLCPSGQPNLTPDFEGGYCGSGAGGGGGGPRSVFINHIASPRPPKILESPMDSKSLVSEMQGPSVPRGPPFAVTLVKDGAGLGFSLEGGKDSPLGDRPLTVKKIFTGGAADKGSVLQVGDELLSVNSMDLTAMARIEAWNFLKKLPDGTVCLIIRQKILGGENGEAALPTGEAGDDKKSTAATLDAAGSGDGSASSVASAAASGNLIKSAEEKKT